MRSRGKGGEGMEGMEGMKEGRKEGRKEGSGTYVRPEVIVHSL